IHSLWEEPAIPFDPRKIQVEDRVEPDVIARVLSLIRDTNHSFQGQPAVLNLFEQLVDEGRVIYSDELPGPFRAQKVVLPDGTVRFYLLVNQALRGHYNGLSRYIQNASPEERSALDAYLTGKLIHETSEVLMESHPDVRWDLGHADPQ